MENVKNKLFVSEVFFSLQGEGSTMGIPSVFLRLAGCNLFCGKNNASWRCDTIKVWQKGNKKEFQEVLSHLYIDKLRLGAHLVITGGEPLLQQDKLIDYLDWFRKTYKFLPYIEIETNGSIYPNLGIRSMVDLWNCSPKLSNSGEGYVDRIDCSALGAINSDNSIFKFVIINQFDWKEIEELLEKRAIDRDKIWLMPAASNIKQLLKRNQQVSKIALENNVKFCTRLQVEIWNKTVGV